MRRFFPTTIIALLIFAMTADAGCGLFSRMRARRASRVAARRVQQTTVVTTTVYQVQPTVQRTAVYQQSKSSCSTGSCR